MAEHVILFAGPMGAGKTPAVQSLSEIPVVSTEAANSERNVVDKATTTVALDYGEIRVSDDEKIRLYGVPGQRRFDFMWSILRERARGLVLLVNNDAPDAVALAVEYLGSFAELVESGKVVVGITRTDTSATPTLAEYHAAFAAAWPASMLPVLTVDPRDAAQMQTALMTLVAIIEARDSVAAIPELSL